MFSGYHQTVAQKLRKMGLSPSQIRELRKYGLLARDNVTGFYEARFGAGRIWTLRRAIQYVKKTGKMSFYVEMDLQNLKGLNAALGHSEANKIYRAIAAIARKWLSTVASQAFFFRHGGDETSAFLINTSEQAVENAMEMAKEEVCVLARKCGVDTLPNLRSGLKGIGIHFGVCQLLECHENDPTVVFSEADRKLERHKVTLMGQ